MMNRQYHSGSVTWISTLCFYIFYWLIWDYFSRDSLISLCSPLYRFRGTPWVTIRWLRLIGIPRDRRMLTCLARDSPETTIRRCIVVVCVDDAPSSRKQADARWMNNGLRWMSTWKSETINRPLDRTFPATVRVTWLVLFERRERGYHATDPVSLSLSLPPFQRPINRPLNARKTHTLQPLVASDPRSGLLRTIIAHLRDSSRPWLESTGGINDAARGVFEGSTGKPFRVSSEGWAGEEAIKEGTRLFFVLRTVSCLEQPFESGAC